MAVGFPAKTTYANGDVFSASDINDTNGTLNLLGQSVTTSAGKNAIINGGMDIWQRGTTSTSTGYVTADRWSMYSSAVTTTNSRESTIVPAGLTYSLKFAQATNTATIIAQQAIETANAIAYAGKNVTLSAYVAASASTTLVIDVEYSTSVDVAVGGSWTATTLVSGTASATVATTASFTRISGVYSIPSTAKSLKVRVYSLSLTAGTSCYISGVQMELGSTATTFSRAGGTIQGELAACQRYYAKSYDIATAPATATQTGSIAIETADYNGSHWLYIRFPVAMRVAPTITLYSPTTGTAGQWRIFNQSRSTNADNAMSTTNIGDSGFQVYASFNGSLMIGHYVANGEL
jgi:hypothetical protein